MSDDYSCVSSGKLKLKKDDSSIKKKKKKCKDKDKEREKAEKALNDSNEEERQRSATKGGGSEPKLTKAELAFKQQQEKMRNKRIMEKALTTHKQRVEKFNEHLDTLTEHFDIPKVSWTK